MKADKLIAKGKFYLKSGSVVEEEIIFDEDNKQEDIDKAIADIKQVIKDGFKDTTDFQITFGFTTLRGSDLSAVKITLE